MIGALPPIKGVSPYTAELVSSLSNLDDVELEFVGFSSIYPSWLYPGGAPAEKLPKQTFAGVRVRQPLAWYNPFSWLWAGLTLRGRVVHAQWWSFALLPVYLTVLAVARLRGRRVVMTVHNVSPHESGNLKRWLNQAVFRFADRFIVHSEKNREALAAATGRPDSIDVLPMGAIGAPRTGISRSDARRRLGIEEDARVVLAFGNIRSYKGLDVLIEAFAEVRARDPRALLVVAGKPWGSWQPYADAIQRHRIAESVRLFLDFVPTPRVEEFFLAADVVALPYTHFDAQSAVAALALPFGRPLIVSAVGGLPDFVLDRTLVVPPGDAGALARVLTMVLGDDVLRERLGGETLRLSRELNWAPIGQATAAVYRAVLEAGAGSELRTIEEAV